jgi:hypothetical protein
MQHEYLGTCDGARTQLLISLLIDFPGQPSEGLLFGIHRLFG